MKTFGSLLLASILGAVLALSAEHGINSGFISEARASNATCETALVKTTNLVDGDDDLERARRQIAEKASSLSSRGYRVVGFSLLAGRFSPIAYILACQ